MFCRKDRLVRITDFPSVMLAVNRKTGTQLLIQGLPWLILVLLAGCTADAYKRSADLQVGKLLEDRQRQTLDYSPKITPGDEFPSPAPPARAFDRIPVTTLPQPQPYPLEPSPTTLPFAPLGPEHPVLTTEQTLPEWLTPGGVPSPLRLGPELEPGEQQTLDLFGALAYGVNHAREYRNRMEDVYLAALTVTLERHLLSPRPFARTGVRYTGSQRENDYRSALAVTNAVGVRQRLPYGGEVVAQALVDFVEALRGPVADAESARLVLSGSVPLLRGAGMVNLEGLISSERELVYALRSFEEFRRNYAVQVATAYFNLLNRQQAIENRRRSLRVLAQLTEQTEALYAAGRVNFLQVQRALQSRLRAETSLIDAINAYEAALDNFKILIGMEVSQPLRVVAIELEVTSPDLQAVDPTELALRYRLDVQTARDRIEDAQRAVQHARRDLLPELNLVGSGQVGNVPGTDLTRVDSGTAQYSGGVDLELPLDRLAERNRYRQALITLERRARAYEALQENVIASVRQSVRQIRAARVTLEIQQRGIELAQRRLDFANELLVTGRATDSRDVVEAQNDLLNAQDQYDRARADLQIQVLQFLRETGTLRVDPDAGTLGLAMRWGHD